MQRIAKNTKLTALETLKYTSPIPLRVRSREMDAFVYRAVAEAPFASGFVMSLVGLILAIALYVHQIHKIGLYGDLWMGAHIIEFAISIITFKYLYKIKKLGKSGITKTYLIAFFPIVLDSFLWGSMPLLIEDKTGYMASFYFVGACLIVYGNCAWITGLTWFSLLYAILSSIPIVVYFYTNQIDFWNIMVTIVLFYIGTWGAAHSMATGVISNAVSQFALQQQSYIIEDLLNEFQVNSSDWVWETDKQHKIKFISIESETADNQLVDMELLNTDFIQLFDAKDPNLISLEDYLDQRKPFDQLIMSFDPKLNSGKKHVWELRGRPVLDENKNFVGFRGFGRDITNIQELNELNSSKDKFDIMSKFVAKIAHDFNNSLMVIQSSVEILGYSENDMLSSEGKEVISTVKDVVKSASRVNKELLSFARQEVLNPSTVDINTIILDLTKKYKLRAPDVEFIVRPFKPSLVHVDQYALIRTLENLLVNSIEAMNNIGTITLSGARMDWGRGKQFILRIEDNGPGFSEAALKSASDPFFTTKKQIGGSGLGMATAAGFVQQSGGEMHWSNTTSGALVDIKLQAAMTEICPSNSPKHIDAPNLSSTRILVVDDDLKVLSSLGRQFKDLCGEVVLANSIDLAIKCVEQSPSKFDVILCDFQFDDDERHGVDLAEIVADKIRYVIFMTGYSELSKELINYDVLPKPFSMQEFIETYHSLLIRGSRGFRRQKNMS